MKKSSLIICLVLISFLIVGCSNNSNTKTKSKTIKKFSQITSKSGSLTCSREATASDGVTPDFNYYIKFNGDRVLELHSVEKVTSDSSESLDTYEEAYKNINKLYKGLKYYDTSVNRDKTSVTRDTVINYEKIDKTKLLQIEGDSDNIIKDGKAKLSLWLEMASKFGVTCKED